MGHLRPRYRFTAREQGDLAPASPGVAGRRRAITDLPWTWLDQVHGDQVVVVGEPGEHAGVRADAAVTVMAGAALAVQAADCAPVVLLGDGVVGVVHAGWRGLVAGVVTSTVQVMRRLRPGPLAAVVGPCIRPPCYEFGPSDLAMVAAVVGDQARGRTLQGRPALDLASGIRAALSAAGVERYRDVGTCTACSPRHWSHRGGGDVKRQGAVAWLAW